MPGSSSTTSTTRSQSGWLMILSRLRVRGARVSRQLHGEEGPLPDCALDADRAAHRLHQHLDDPQPEAEAAVVLRGDRAREALEDALLFALGDADAMVA